MLVFYLIQDYLGKCDRILFSSTELKSKGKRSQKENGVMSDFYANHTLERSFF